MKLLTAEIIEIINEIARWKAITQRELFKTHGRGKTYANFSIKMKSLERAGLIKGFYEGNKGKYLILTKNGSQFSVHPYMDYESSGSLIHDLICTAVMKSLLEHPLFSSGTALDYVKSPIQPDGVIYAKRYGTSYLLAVEVELNQKSQKRVHEKFVKYANDPEFHHVLYVTQKRSVYDAYGKILKGLHEEIASRIALCLAPDLSPSGCDYLKATYWLRGKTLEFNDLFGEKNEG